MTYRQYYIRLIKDLGQIEAFKEEQYQKLKEGKDFLDESEMEVYTKLQNDLKSLMEKTARVSHLIESNQVKSTANIDPDVLGFLPLDIAE